MSERSVLAMPHGHRSSIAALLGLLAVAAAEAPKLPKPIVLEGSESHHDLRYLPDERYTGNPHLRGDREMLLDLHLPEGRGQGPYPVVFTYHGGAWTTGSKEGTGFNPLFQALLGRGYAVIGFNYVMRGKDVVPQVFYDTQDAVRWVRMNAEKYRLDPTRIGASGISAGGWLASYMGFTHGDVVIHETQGGGMEIAAFAQGGKRGNPPWGFANLHDWWGKAPAFAFPAWNPEPAWPEHCGTVQAVSYDFSMWHSHVQPGGASANQWAGKDHHHKDEKFFTAAGVIYDYSWITTARGQQHGPAFDSPCVPLDGGAATVPLAERIAQFYAREFGPEGRAPAPEIRPFLRVFAAPVTVSLLVPDPAMVIHYTTDGSAPTTASPLYTASFTIDAATTVKALAIIAGRKPSGVVSATFLPGPVPPRISGPDGVLLPPGERGKPYRIAFTADTPEAVWRLGGEMLPTRLDVKNSKEPLVDRIGLSLDPATGVLSGTPKRGGAFWVQIQCARGAGRLASIRNYVLRVAGDPGAPTPDAAGSEDPNQELARLRGWSPAHQQGLMEALTAAGHAPVLADAGDEALLLVPGDQLGKARPVLEAYARKNGLKTAR